MGNYDKHFWGSREQRKKISGSREHELKTFLGTRGFINGEQGIKSKKIKGSWEHVPPPGRGSDSNSPQPEVHIQQPTEKKGYFQDIVSLPQTHSNKAGSAPNAKHLDCTLPLHTQTEQEETGHRISKTSRSSSGFHTIGKTILEEELCSAVPVLSTDSSDICESVKSVVTRSNSDGKVE